MKSALRNLMFSFLFFLVSTQISFGNDYFPVQEGATWKFKDSNNKTIFKRVVREEKIGYYPSFLVEVADEKSVFSSEHIGTTTEGVFRYSLNGRRFEKGSLILKANAKAGEKWPVNFDFETSKINLDVVLTEEEITVPAGKFKCLITTCDSKDEKGTIFQVKNFYALKVGVVKMSVEKAGKKIYELELLEYKPLKDETKKTP